MARTNKPIKHLVVHCTATKPSTHVDASVIDRWHRQRGFLKIGYHYVILRSGEVQKGRLDTEVGAHVQGHNTGSLGICLVGGISETSGKPEANYTEEQYAALASLLKQLKLDHPDAKVLGHRDFSPDRNRDGIIQKSEWIKVCPCFEVAEWWASVDKEN